MKKKTATPPDAGEQKGISFATRDFGNVTVITSTYRNGDSVAVELVDENGESIATLSVNIPERAHLLGDGEFFAKTWSENAEIAEDALASGIFHDTGRRSDDNLNTQIWKFK
jgi:hypothetical protein